MVSIRIDGVDQLNQQLADLMRRVDDATNRGVDDGLEEVAEQARALLSRQSHAPFTSTPSVAPQPPAQISGRLGESIVPTREASEDGLHTGRVGPTAIQGRIQELGGVILPVRAPHLSWFVDGQWHHAMSSYLPPRPYMAPAVELAIPAIIGGFIDLWTEAIHPS